MKLLLTSLLLLPVLIRAQSLQVATDTLLWKAEALTDMVTDSTRVNASEFVTYGSSKITWTQTGTGEPTVFEFTVTTVSDHWDSAGYIAYTTTRKNKTQTFRFERSGTEKKVTFTFPLAEGSRTLAFALDEVLPLPEQP